MAIPRRVVRAADWSPSSSPTISARFVAGTSSRPHPDRTRLCQHRSGPIRRARLPHRIDPLKLKSSPASGKWLRAWWWKLATAPMAPWRSRWRGKRRATASWSPASTWRSNVEPRRPPEPKAKWTSSRGARRGGRRGRRWRRQRPEVD